MHFVAGFTQLSLKDQMRLLQGSWSEVLILSLVFRSLPTTVAAASVAAKEKASNGGVKKWKLKFAPDFALNENMATDSGLEEFYSHVSFLNCTQYLSGICKYMIDLFSAPTFWNEQTD